MVGPDLLGISSPHRETELGLQGADLQARNFEMIGAKFGVATLCLPADLAALPRCDAGAHGRQSLAHGKARCRS